MTAASLLSPTTHPLPARLLSGKSERELRARNSPLARLASERTRSRLCLISQSAPQTSSGIGLASGRRNRAPSALSESAAKTFAGGMAATGNTPHVKIRSRQKLSFARGLYPDSGTLSVNDEPRGADLTKELIPQIEAHDRMDSCASGRFPRGHCFGAEQRCGVLPSRTGLESCDSGSRLDTGIRIRTVFNLVRNLAFVEQLG